MTTKDQFIIQFKEQQKIRDDFMISPKHKLISQRFEELIKKLINKDQAYSYEIKNIDLHNNDNYDQMTNACKNFLILLKKYQSY